jgi:hypothetical protein
MADVFEKTLKPWTYTAIFPQVLKTTQLPQPTVAANERLLTERELAFATPRHDAAYWERVFAGQNFSVEDKLDTAQFNVALWKGLMGEDTPYPTTRHGRDLSHDRARLLREFWVRQNRTLTVAQAE